jgi:glucose-6-phosphate isomerase/transaldolase/glucose-6-phosphate isomerase
VKGIEEGKGPRQWHNLGREQPAVDEAVRKLHEEEAPRRLWARDAKLWTQDPGRSSDYVEWLGWLTVPEKLLDRASQLQELARAGREYRDVVLLGMGGSSLCPDVLRHTFGPQEGHPALHVLDTTDPATIAGVRSAIDPARTLFVVASKSGSTQETLSHLAYFWEETTGAVGDGAGGQFAAITDPGTSLEELARERRFRWVFLNPPDIGGRYSALSYFGMVPGALMGVDVAEMLERATEMAHSCDASVDVEKNPGVWLGAVLGALASRGRDKLTLVLSRPVATFGYWVEQLIAESTGKQGRGIVPVEGEPLGEPGVYGSDRLFVYVRMDEDPDHEGVRALERAGLPVVTLTLRDRLDLGGEFLRWEIATAVAGSILGIDPFDQPNVQESKDNTRRVLAGFEAEGRLPEAEASAASAAGPELARMLRDAADGSYFAIMAYTARNEESERAVAEIRTAVRDRLRLATTAGYGPRFLHSTGQLHKGGPRKGVFLQIVEEDGTDVPIPGQRYGFSVLKQAQALGDLESLRSRGCPVLRVTLGRSPASGWAELAASVGSALK